MGKSQSLGKMEGAICSIVEIHNLRNIHLTTVACMYNEQRNTHLKLLPENKTKVPNWDNHRKRGTFVICNMKVN